MENTGFVKLPRSLLNVEWALDPTTFAVFAYILLLANYEERQYNGCNIPRGAAIISQRGISAHFKGKITPSQARTAIRKLCQNGITQVLAQSDAHPQQGICAQQGAHPCTIVIVCNYDSYNGNSNGARAPKRAPNPLQNAQFPAQKGAHSKEIERENEEICKEIVGKDSWILPILLDWIAYKREKGQAYKGRKGITQFYNLLKGYSGGNAEKAWKIVKAAMAANYATVFPPKGGAPNKGSISTNTRIDIEAIPPEEQISTI